MERIDLSAIFTSQSYTAVLFYGVILRSLLIHNRQ